LTEECRVSGVCHSNKINEKTTPRVTATLHRRLAGTPSFAMTLRVLLVFVFVRALDCLSVNVKPGQAECFFVTTTPETPCFGSFEILSPDPEPLSILVRGPLPLHKVVHESRYRGDGAIDKHETEGSFSFTADLEGDYGLCITNEEPSQEKVVAFNFRCVEIAGDIDYEFASMQSELFDLQRGLNFLKDHQSFMNQREDRHRAILESTNFKVLGWTVLEAIILIGMALWQIAYISKFFETKRKM
jgi:hypothetical protein